MNLDLETKINTLVQSEPFIDGKNVLHYAFRSIYTNSKDLVPVRMIVGSSSYGSWQNVYARQRLPGYFEKMYADIKSGSFDLAEGRYDLPDLLEFGGLYVVESNGNHRVVAAKLIGVDRILARVTHIERVESVCARTPQEYQALIDRKGSGLWNGDINIRVNRREFNWGNLRFNHHFFASGEVRDYKDIFVFSNNMDHIRAISENCNASLEA